MNKKTATELNKLKKASLGLDWVFEIAASRQEGISEMLMEDLKELGRSYESKMVAIVKQG